MIDYQPILRIAVAAWVTVLPSVWCGCVEASHAVVAASTELQTMLPEAPQPCAMCSTEKNQPITPTKMTHNTTADPCGCEYGSLANAAAAQSFSHESASPVPVPLNHLQLYPLTTVVLQPATAALGIGQPPLRLSFGRSLLAQRCLLLI